MLSIKGLSRPGIKPFSLDIDAGECIALMGASGSGKTLLLRTIADLDPNQGEVFLDQVNRNDMLAPEWRSAVGYLAGEAGWWADEVGRHFPDHDLAAALFLELGFTLDTMGWQVARLSTGERQRLALARSLLIDPKVLLLDEPTSGLDADSTAVVENILNRSLARGTAILLVTHDTSQATRLAGKRLRMSDGDVTEDAS